MEDKINLSWRKSSYSGNGGGNCVEVASGALVLVRDSQDRAGTVLRFPSAAWRKFADQVKHSLALDPVRWRAGRVLRAVPIHCVNDLPQPGKWTTLSTRLPRSATPISG
jgi:hypothetical protein